MSHLKQREENNCLNCNAIVHGRFCHICGQENVEPAESAWHLVNHFFNDITHFDGKFFSTLKLLITRPGFLPAEYKRGRRTSYLNPVKMYIFSSFIFFIIVFKLFPADQAGFNSVTVSGFTQAQVNALDSTEFVRFTKTLTQGRVLTRTEYVKYVDSLLNDKGYSLISSDYKSRQQYDSLVRTGSVKDNWFTRWITLKDFELREKYKNHGEALRSVRDKMLHTFSQVLFISLPFFSMLLTLIYRRRKEFYFVSHGIYGIHLYIFYFIILLALFGLGRLEKVTGWKWLDIFDMLCMLAIPFYEYKAMRNFYGQRRAKTVFKFLLAFIGRLVIMFILVAIFLIFSIYTL